MFVSSQAAKRRNGKQPFLFSMTCKFAIFVFLHEGVMLRLAIRKSEGSQDQNNGLAFLAAFLIDRLWSSEAPRPQKILVSCDRLYSYEA